MEQKINDLRKAQESEESKEHGQAKKSGELISQNSEGYSQMDRIEEESDLPGPLRYQKEEIDAIWWRLRRERNFWEATLPQPSEEQKVLAKLSKIEDLITALVPIEKRSKKREEVIFCWDGSLFDISTREKEIRMFD